MQPQFTRASIPKSGYPDPRLQALAARPGGIARLADASGLTPRALRNVRAGRSTPRVAPRRALAALVMDAPTTPPERRCAGCGEPLTAGNPRQRYCSRACQQHAYRARRQQPGTATP